MSIQSNILVVDDSATIRLQLRAILEAEGLQVFEAANGEEGLVQAVRQPIDLFILDINMPGTDGLEMLEQLRTLDDHADTPAFVLTAESSQALVDRGREVGATAWILKPIKAAALVRGVHQVLSLASKRRAHS